MTVSCENILTKRLNIGERKQERKTERPLRSE